MARLAAFLVFVLSLAGTAQAGSLLPEIPKATGEAHAEGNEFWRKNHMDMMQHDRDLTLRMGERDIEASLKECFECHAVKDDHGTPVTYSNDKHFCRVCHDYAAVKVDCFMCHRSTPDGVDENAQEGNSHAGLMSRPEGDAGEVAGYLERVKRPARRNMMEAGE
ncbi:hypothetical protein RXV86_02275 [Alisedimentitalea sp. MJ-SS2]|uniref:hypothetical protein n=1 Tax=Aliisedimentitalea sp. MJ-SS2 TaxID=3049795 RepID=UPI002908543D|nr:hypothetical protein [Alisedimentitalea sp. MJ-SS2]MDU8926200.1 hypothetical protein [Alisedimentitalea sp. MJ-SS2]